MRLIKSIYYYGYDLVSKTNVSGYAYETKETNNVRGNEEYVLPRDAVFERVGVDIGKFKHHEIIAENLRI